MNHPSNENIPSRSFSYHAFNFTFLLLLAVFFISLYTVALLKSNSRITLSAAVERNISCSDAVHRAISSRLTRADFEQIHTKSDMNSAQYRSLQSYLNELRSLNSTRYLYTAKRGPGGKPIYLIDGLDLEAPDFAYPGTYLEEEMVPYLEAALSGKTIHSQKIIDTTWGHIFTACYPVIASDGTNDILGALCIEIDMEDTYRSIEAINRSSFGIAAAASMIALLLIVISYFYTKKQKSRELTQQQLLEQTAKAAEAANKAKSTFLFNMSHDIRTPMNAILGYAELARNHLQEPEKIGEYMDKIHISGEKMLSIINNILQFSQIENNQIHIEETSVQTEKSFDSCIVMVQTALEEKQQHFHVTKDISYPYIYIDMTYMSEIILNILSNAIKYTAKGGTISCALRQEPGETDGWCITEIAITDTGIGISEEFQSHIFESFSRERSSTVSGIEGTGLGMGIVKNLVDLMHGTIEVKSKLGEGSTFTVRIPCRISSREETEPTAFDETAAQTLSGCRILLAEDNDLNAEISIELLTREGLLVERANDGVACLEMLQKAPEDYYDLILMDIQMPEMDGFAVLELLRRSNLPQARAIPVIALTARMDDEREYLARGFAGCIRKPFTMESLAEGVTRVTGKKGNGDWKPDFSLILTGEDNRREMLEVFITEGRKDLSLLHEALEKGDRETVRDILHKNLPLWDTLRLDFRIEELRRITTTAPGSWTAEDLAGIREIERAANRLLRYAINMKKEEE